MKAKLNFTLKFVVPKVNRKGRNNFNSGLNSYKVNLGYPAGVKNATQFIFSGMKVKTLHFISRSFVLAFKVSIDIKDVVEKIFSWLNYN